MPTIAILILVALVIIGFVLKPVRHMLIVLIVFFGIELAVIIAWPRTLVWLAEIALRIKGVGQSL